MRRFAALASFAAAATAAAAVPAAAPVERGERLYRRACYSCHALEPGRNSAAGPTLHGIVGRRIAAQDGFNYSPALRRFAARQRRWTPVLIDRFVADPETLVPGSEMSFIGMSDVDRRALIAWLNLRARRN